MTLSGGPEQSHDSLRGFFALTDLLVLLPLALLARRSGASRVAPALVAWGWSPLVVLEFAGAGHFDSLGILALLAALVRQGYDTNALSFSLKACEFALKANAFPHRVQLVTNSLLLAERARALGIAAEVERAKTEFLKLPDDLQQLVAGYLAAVNAAASDQDPAPGDDGSSDPQGPGR